MSDPEVGLLSVLLQRRTAPDQIVLGSPGLYTFINPYSYLVFRNQAELLVPFDGLFFDALTMVAALNVVHHAGVHRNSFDLGSMAGPVLARAEAEGLTVFFAGTTEDRLAAAMVNIRSAYPELRIAGTRHGFFDSPATFQRTVEDVARTAPDVLIAGMGAPLQEKFLTAVWNAGWRGTGFTCGGFLEQTAHSIRYYHPLVNRLSLRWLVRIVRHRHVLVRVVRDYPRALTAFVRDSMDFRRHSEDSTPKATAPVIRKTGL